METLRITSGSFTLPAVSVDDDSDWVQVAKLILAGRNVNIRGLVGSAGALAHLRITQVVFPGDTHRQLAVDTEFIDDSLAIPWCLYDTGGAGPHETAADGDFQIPVRTNAYEIIIEAKKASTTTTLQISGMVIGK